MSYLVESVTILFVGVGLDSILLWTSISLSRGQASKGHQDNDEGFHNRLWFGSGKQGNKAECILCDKQKATEWPIHVLDLRLLPVSRPRGGDQGSEVKPFSSPQPPLGPITPEDHGKCQGRKIKQWLCVDLIRYENGSLVPARPDQVQFSHRPPTSLIRYHFGCTYIKKDLE